MRGRTVVCSLLVLVALRFATGTLHGQVVAGRVLEESTQAPVHGAQVQLLAASAGPVGVVTTDSGGWFQLRALTPGSYRLGVQHIAYVPFSSSAIDVASGQMVMVEIRLGRDAIPLEPLRVTAKRADLARLAGFRQRSATNQSGRFVTRDQIDRRPAANTSDFFRTMPSVHVLPVKRNANPNGMMTYVIMMRGSGSEDAPTGADPDMAGMCSPAIFLDGTRIGQSAIAPIDDLIQSTALEGIEVYTSFASVPAEYQTGGNCGAILLWSRAGEGGGKRGWLRHALGAAGIGVVALLMLGAY